MSRQSRSVPWLVASAIGLLMVGLCLHPPALADDPINELAEVCEAAIGDIEIIPVDPQREGEFLTALVHNGAFHGAVPVFANETIAKALPGMSDSASSVFFCVARHYDEKSMSKVANHRREAIAPYLKGEPTSYQVRVVEHLLANWGHERGEEVSFETVVPGQDGHAFEDYNSSLSYFKGGYSGQMSVLEVYREGLPLDRVREDLTRRKGMSGATIFRDKNSDTYIAYSQYFQSERQQLTPAKLEAGSLVVRRFAGQVAQNYSSR